MGGYPGLFKGAQCHHKAPYEGKEAESGKQISKRDLKMLAASSEEG